MRKVTMPWTMVVVGMADREVHGVKMQLAELGDGLGIGHTGEGTVPKNSWVHLEHRACDDAINSTGKMGRRAVWGGSSGSAGTGPIRFQMLVRCSRMKKSKCHWMYKSG